MQERRAGKKGKQGPGRQKRGEPRSEPLKLDAETLKDLDLTDRPEAEDVGGGAMADSSRCEETDRCGW